MHFNDNGINKSMVDDENDLQLELLDIFGIDTQEAKEKNEYKVN